MHERTLRNRADTPGLPIPANVVTVERFTLPGGRRMYGIAALQQHGRFLDALYVTQINSPSSSDLRAVAVLATITGNRLAAVD